MQNDVQLEKLLAKIVRKGRNSGQAYTETIALALWNCLRRGEREAVSNELTAIQRRNDEFGQRMLSHMTSEEE